MHDPAPARLTQRALFQVNPFDGVRRGHDAAVVVAVGQVQGVPEFVDGFFQQPLQEQVVVLGQAVKFLS